MSELPDQDADITVLFAGGLFPGGAMNILGKSGRCMAQPAVFVTMNLAATIGFLDVST